MFEGVDPSYLPDSPASVLLVNHIDKMTQFCCRDPLLIGKRFLAATDPQEVINSLLNSVSFTHIISLIDYAHIILRHKLLTKSGTRSGFQPQAGSLPLWFLELRKQMGSALNLVTQQGGLPDASDLPCPLCRK